MKFRKRIEQRIRVGEGRRSGAVADIEKAIERADQSSAKERRP
jgi:hypothetical protein